MWFNLDVHIHLGIVTQSMVISLLDQNLDKFPTIRKHKVEQMVGGLEQHLITVNENDRAIDVSYTNLLYQSTLTATITNT